MQELGKFDFKINEKHIGKHTGFNISNKLIFIDSFQFLSSSLNILVKNLGKGNFKYLSQEFDSKI